MGLCIGVFPGLGGIAGLSLLLPFMFGMEPLTGLALMVGMVAVVPTSDTFASVLMGIPGSSASQATVLDGFPMAKKGMAARALSAAFASSLFGGLVGATFLTVFILIARPIQRLFPHRQNRSQRGFRRSALYDAVKPFGQIQTLPQPIQDPRF